MGGLTSRPTEVLVPPDMAATRQNQIALLNHLLGFGGAPGPGQPRAQQGGGGPLSNLMSQVRGGGGGAQSNDFLGGQANPLDRLQSFFGTLGSPPSALQRQATGGISQYLNQPAPEQRALDIALPGLQEILNGGGPQFEKDLSLANQQGGRFGSANAIMRGEAFRNLYNQRDQAAQTLGMLSSAAGQNPFARLIGAQGVGQQNAQQADIETQRRLQILLQLLGVAQQTAFNMPITQGQSPLDQLGQIASLIPIPGLGGLLGGGGSAPARTARDKGF